MSVSLQCANNTASVTWTQSPGAIGYNVTALGRDSDVKYCRTSNTYCQIPNMHCSQTYNFVVIPFSDICNGLQSNAFTFTAGMYTCKWASQHQYSVRLITVRLVLYPSNLIPFWYQVHAHPVESRCHCSVKIMLALSAGLLPSMLRSTLAQQQAQMVSGTTAPQMEPAACSLTSTVERTTVSRSLLFSMAAGVTRVNLCYWDQVKKGVELCKMMTMMTQLW